MTKLNLGCGSKKLPGWVNVDAQPMEDPDVVVDIGREIWPWPDNSVDEALASHVIEHIPPAEPFFHFMRELHRVSKPGAKTYVILPHPRHDIFLQDPTHVHAVMPGTMAMFSKKYAERLAENGQQLTPFWKYFNIDFDFGDVKYAFSEGISADDPELSWKAKHLSNVIFQWEAELTAVK